ncbi:RNA polymerase sigma factor [Patescibacteria group bacterium]|nr:RNA polymerase sigma factor [Patescibacteria group bacterium]
MVDYQEAFSKIYDQYIDKIYRFIFLKVSSQEIAEDLCSETFTRGWQAFKKSQNPSLNNKTIENPSAFLYQIARNLIVDHYRQKGRAQIVSTEYIKVSDPRTDLQQQAIIGSDMNMIRRAMVNIKEDYQDVIIWRYLDELSTSEIAKIMDKSEEAVRVTLHRALKSLKEELKEA